MLMQMKQVQTSTKYHEDLYSLNSIMKQWKSDKSQVIYETLNLNNIKVTTGDRGESKAAKTKMIFLKKNQMVCIILATSLWT